MNSYQSPCIRHRFAVCAAVGAIGLLVSAAANASDPEVEALRKELQEQKAIIQQLLDAQQAQKFVNAKVAQFPVVNQNPATVTSGPSITPYGVADLNVASGNSGYGRKTTVGSGGLASSRIGVKAERDIGDGFKAIGVAEAGLLLDTGSAGNASVVPGINSTYASSSGQQGTGSQLFSRQVYAGLASTQYGSITMGRQYAPSYGAVANLNALNVGLYGFSGALLPAAGMPTRTNNALLYYSPAISGVTGQLMYTTGSENNTNGNVPTAAGSATKTNDKAGHGFDASLSFNSGPLYAVLTGWSLRATSFAAGETDLAKKTGWQIGASYDFGVVRVYATGLEGKIAGGDYENVTKALSKTQGWSVSASAPFGKNKVYVSYTSFNDKSPLDRDANLWGVGYTYDLFANTKLYAAWGKTLNNRNGTYSLPDSGDLVGNVGTPGFHPSSTMAGMDFTF